MVSEHRMGKNRLSSATENEGDVNYNQQSSKWQLNGMTY